MAVPKAAVVSARAKERGRQSALQTYLWRGLIVLVLIALWQYADGRWVPDYLISSPVHVVQRLAELFATITIWNDIWVTAQELLLGYVTGVVIGLVAGVVLGLWDVAGTVFEPIIAAINGVPKVALAPLFLIWLGIGITSKVAIAAMTVFFVMFYNVYLSVRTVPRNLKDVLRIMGAGRGFIVREVVLPSTAVPVVAGLKASVPFAMIGVVVGEFIAAQAGVGYYIRYSTDMYDSAGIYAGILLLVAMVLISNSILGMVSGRVLRQRGRG